MNKGFYDRPFIFNNNGKVKKVRKKCDFPFTR